MAKCRFYVHGCAACNSGLYKSQSPVKLNKRETAYHIKDPAIIREFCNKEPHKCVYNPDGLGFASKKKRQEAMNQAVENDRRNMSDTSGTKYTLGVLAVLAIIVYWYIK